MPDVSISIRPIGRQPGKSAASQPDSPVVLVPSQGRPAFCTPGEQFSCLLHLSTQIGEAPRFWLQNSRQPCLRYPLLQVGGLKLFGDGYARVQLSPPDATPPGLYNLLVAGSVRETLCRRSVSVIPQYKTSFRFVHLSNMNIGDPTAVQFDPHLPEEINLLAPEFIIATGDYTEWARTMDSPDDWQRVLDYMARFEAPVFMLCGDHDHEASFTQYVANSLIGTIDYGRYHGLLLLDHGYHPIEQDDEQIQWILSDLAANHDKTFNFLVTHSDELGLIRRFKEMNVTEQVFRDGRVKMLICGGQTDWDYNEFSSVLAGLPGLNFIRTAQSSTAVCDRASGVSHYRVIEVNNDRVSLCLPERIARPAHAEFGSLRANPDDLRQPQRRIAGSRDRQHLQRAQSPVERVPHLAAYPQGQGRYAACCGRRHAGAVPGPGYTLGRTGGI